MKVYVDDEDDGRTVQNGVTVVQELEEGVERHLRVTRDGLTIDIVSEKEAVDSVNYLWSDVVTTTWRKKT